LRPLVVGATLARTRLRRNELAFIAWAGLKGAVPILLAAFAVLGGVGGADRVYGIVFVVVLVSVIGQGTLVPVVARVLEIPMQERPSLPWELAVGLGEEPRGAREFRVAPGSPAEGREIRELPLGAHAWITLVVRDGAALQPSGSVRLCGGDRVLLLTEPDDEGAVSQLFETDVTAHRARGRPDQ
jgi:cell volume regulation protein A